MKKFIFVIALGMAGVAASIIFFLNHKSCFVLILSLVMCLLTMACVIRAIINSETCEIYLSSAIISFLGFFVVGGYINTLTYLNGGWGNFFVVTFLTGIISLPVILVNKKSRDSIISLFGDGVRQMFTFSSEPEGCLANVLIGIFGIILTVCLGGILLFIMYITATCELLFADIGTDENIFTTLKKINVTLFKKHIDPSSTFTSPSTAEKDDGEWL